MVVKLSLCSLALYQVHRVLKSLLFTTEPTKNIFRRKNPSIIVSMTSDSKYVRSFPRAVRHIDSLVKVFTAHPRIVNKYDLVPNSNR